MRFDPLKFIVQTVSGHKEITLVPGAADGARGPEGVPGWEGPRGRRGESGLVVPGPQGLVGATGAAGSNGSNGATGSTGPTGAMGLMGPPGMDGKSRRIEPMSYGIEIPRHAQLPGQTANDHHAQVHGAGDHTDRTRHIFVPAGPNWLPIAGTPDYALRNSIYPATAFDKDTTEALVNVFTVPSDYASDLAVSVVWTNLGAGSGSVAWRTGINNQGDTGNLSGVTTYDTTAVAPSQNVIKYTVTAAAFPNVVTSGQLVLFSIGRIATDVADTLANDAGFYGYLVNYTADM